MLFPACDRTEVAYPARQPFRSKEIPRLALAHNFSGPYLYIVGTPLASVNTHGAYEGDYKYYVVGRMLL
jgi:hypothetical protein